MTDNNSRIEPDWISAPGETIVDLLEERGWSQSEFAQRIGCTPKHASMLVHGRASISQDTASRLEKVLGGTTRFWLTREAQYQEAIARAKEQQILSSQSQWLRELPLSHMVKCGWVDKKSSKAEQVAECLAFFGVASAELWRRKYTEVPALAAFKASNTYVQKTGAVAAWLRQGEREATNIRCAPFENTLFKSKLNELRNLTLEPDPAVFVPKLINACARAGVAVVFAPAPRGCPVTGATKWMTKDKALLMLSLRYKTNDHLWFAFFHEAGHLLLHGKKMLFLELTSAMTGGHEQEADSFAQDLLIPPKYAQSLKYLAHRRKEVSAFSKEVGVAPGIVVGRMQHEGILPRSFLNGLKVSYQWGKG